MDNDKSNKNLITIFENFKQEIIIKFLFVDFTSFPNFIFVNENSKEKFNFKKKLLNLRINCILLIQNINESNIDNNIKKIIVNYNDKLNDRICNNFDIDNIERFYRFYYLLKGSDIICNNLYKFWKELEYNYDLNYMATNIDTNNIFF